MIFYRIIIVVVIALFYSHLEITLKKKKFSKKSNVLTITHLIGMNVGGTDLVMIVKYTGLAGIGLLAIFSEGKLESKHHAILDSFIEPIGGFIALLAIGVMCGSMGFVLVYKNN